MKNSFLKQLWVAFKIWVIALAANTLLGSLYLAGSIERKAVYAGLIFGSIFSFPIFCILLIVINHCVSRRKDGLQLFNYVCITGLVLTLLSCAIFYMLLESFMAPGLLFIALVAAITGVTTQYTALFRLTDYDKKLEKFLL